MFTRKSLFSLLTILLVLSIFASACQNAAPVTPSNTANEPASSPAATANSAETGPAAENNTGIQLWVPSSSSSVPLMMAAKSFPEVKVVVYTNHPQAAAEYTAKENVILATGLSVALNMYKNGAPVQMFQSNVSGLSYFVGCNETVTKVEDLKGKEVIFPFEGSPLEEAAQFFVQKAGLDWKADIKPVYQAFDSTTAMIKQGQTVIAALPQPSVSALSGEKCFSLGPSFYELWNTATNTSAGYPQVGVIAKPEFVKAHSEWIKTFNASVKEAIASLEKNPQAAVESVKDYFKLPVPVLVKAVGNTQFNMLEGDAMQKAVEEYYAIVGKPLDEKSKGFFPIP